MIFTDGIMLMISVMALVALYLARKIPRRYGGHIIEPIKFTDHFSRVTKNGKPLPSKWEIRQKRIERLRNLLLWAIAVLGLVGVVLNIYLRH